MPAAQIAVFVFGVVFVVTLLVLAVVLPEPSDFQYTVFRIVLALAAAGVAAFIPGFIEVTIDNWLRAGGAIAVFVVVYFFSPANLVSQPTGQRAKKAMKVTTIVEGGVAGPVITGENVIIGSVGATPKELAEVVSDIVSKHEKELASFGQATSQTKQLLENALRRVQELEQGGNVEGVLTQLRKSGDTSELLRILVENRDQHKDDLMKRNQEIAIIAYLKRDMQTAAEAVSEILCLDPEDLEALNVQANIFWLTSHRDMEKVFNHILEIAKKKNDLEAQIGALVNLGDLYMNQFGSRSHTHPKVATLFYQAKELQRELARQRGVPFYENLPEHIPPLVKGNLLEYERLHSEWIEGKRSATPKEIAVKYGILGIISQKKGDLDKAEERFFKSLKLLESLPEPEALLRSEIANQYVNLGINFALRREYAKAEEYWIQARDRYQYDAKIANTIDQWIKGIRSESSTK